MKDNRIFVDWLTYYQKYVEESESLDLFKTWCGISAICACLERKCFLTWETKLYPNMYIILVAPPGCRKGTAMGPVRNFLTTLGVNIAAEATTRESLIRELSKKCGNQDIDTLTNQIHIHSSLTIWSEELTVFLTQNNWQLISDLNNWFDCPDNWIYRTKNAGTDDIIGVWVNILGATTPTFVTEDMPSGAISGGFISRCVFVFGDKKGKIIPHPPKRDEELMKDLIHDLSLIRMLTGEFSYNESFYKAYTEWYIEEAKNPPYFGIHFLGYCERRATHIRKMAMAFCASRTDDMLLDKHDFNRAKMLLEETEKFMPFVFSGRGRLPEAMILSRIMEQLQIEGEMTVSQIMKDNIKDITYDDLQNRIIRALQKAGYISITVTSKDTILRWKGDLLC